MTKAAASVQCSELSHPFCWFASAQFRQLCASSGLRNRWVSLNTRHCYSVRRSWYLYQNYFGKVPVRCWSRAMWIKQVCWHLHASLNWFLSSTPGHLLATLAFTLHAQEPTQPVMPSSWCQVGWWGPFCSFVTAKVLGDLGWINDLSVSISKVDITVLVLHKYIKNCQLCG